MNTGNANSKCQEAKEDGGQVKFNVSNPCQGKTIENCQPFYFTIALTSQSIFQDSIGQLINWLINYFYFNYHDYYVFIYIFADPRCKSLEQVKFRFKALKTY